MSIKNTMKWWIPAVGLGLLSPFSGAMDLEITRCFYQGDGQFMEVPWTEWVYRYGVVPGQVLVVVSCVVFLLSYGVEKLRDWRREALYLVVVLAVGAGLIVHGVFKDYWGRPRPKQVVEFGGSQVFRPFYRPNFWNQPEPSKSFSCGHCTMGFYFIALAFVGKRRNNRLLFYAGIGLTVILGTLLSITRMAQGGHFASDVIVSGLVMWWVAVGFDEWLIKD